MTKTQQKIQQPIDNTKKVTKNFDNITIAVRIAGPGLSRECVLRIPNVIVKGD